ncbi:MAG: DUF4870 domain-containing protein [Verrucomicrobiota bacterium]
MNREVSRKENYWAMAAHLGTLLGWSILPLINFVIPFIIWQIKKDDMPFAAEQAKEALNFQITLVIYMIICLLICITIVGLVVSLPLLWIIPILELVFTVIAATQVSKGVSYRYPAAIRLIS